MSYQGTLDFGGGARQRDNGFAVASFAAADGTYRWDVGFGGGDAYAIVASSAPGLFIGGRLAGQVDFGGGVRSPDNDAGFLLALDAKGAYRWDLEVEGSFGRVNALALSASGSVLAGGEFRGTVELGGDPASSPAFGTAGFVASYAAGGAWQWQLISEGRVSGIAVDASTDLFIGSTDRLTRTTAAGVPRWSFAGALSVDPDYRWGGSVSLPGGLWTATENELFTVQADGRKGTLIEQFPVRGNPSHEQSFFAHGIGAAAADVLVVGVYLEPIQSYGIITRLATTP